MVGISQGLERQEKGPNEHTKKGILANSLSERKKNNFKEMISLQQPEQSMRW